MRIVHVVQSLGMGGQERLILNLSRELQRRGHEPSVISLEPGGDLRPELGGIPVVDVPRQHGIDPLVTVRMASALARLAPDVVHTHNPSPMFYAIPVATMMRVRRRVHTKHGANIYGARGLQASRVVVRMLSALVAVSEGTAEVARKKERVPARLLHVIKHGIPRAQVGPDDAARARVRDELGIPRDAFVVGTVGRLAPEKDYPSLVRAMTPLLGDRVRLVIVGAGASRGDIERAIEPPVSRFVTLTGARRDVPALLASMDLFSLTSKTEGLPLVIPEAMACALPVVATAVGGLPSVVPESVGKLVPYGDLDGLTRAFRAFVTDAERTKTMGAAARRLALAEFSLEAMTDKYEALYNG